MRSGIYAIEEAMPLPANELCYLSSGIILCDLQLCPLACPLEFLHQSAPLHHHHHPITVYRDDIFEMILVEVESRFLTVRVMNILMGQTAFIEKDKYWAHTSKVNGVCVWVLICYICSYMYIYMYTLKQMCLEIWNLSRLVEPDVVLCYLINNRMSTQTEIILSDNHFITDAHQSNKWSYL